jgi:hypothetical protein
MTWLESIKKKRLWVENLPETQVLGLPGFGVTGNQKNQTNPEKPEDIFSNVLMHSTVQVHNTLFLGLTHLIPPCNTPYQDSWSSLSFSIPLIVGSRPLVNAHMKTNR